MDLLGTFLALGCPPGADAEARRRASVFNAIIGVGAVAYLLLALTDLVTGDRVSLWLMLSGALAASAVFAVHAAGFVQTARVALVVLLTTETFLSARTSAPEDLGCYGLLVASVLAFIVFEPSEPARRWLFSLVPVALFCSVELRHGPVPGIPQMGPLKLARLSNLLSTAIVLCVVVAWLVRVQARVLREREARLAELQKRQQQILQASRLAALGGMAAGVAHEVNNPLTAVILNVERVEQLLDEEPPDTSTAATLMARASDAAGRISQIVGSLLTFARQEPSAPPEPVEARKLMDDALSGRKTDATIDVDAYEKTVVLCHAPDLVEVLRHLLDNAEDAVAGAENGRIRLRAVREGDEVALSVEDNGPGIPEELQGRLMEPFATGKEPGAGPGLGLALSKALVTGNAGRLEFDDGAKLTRFVVHLPAAQEDA